MEQRRLCRAGQRARERLRLFWDDIEAEDLDRDETIAIRLICAENGTKSTNAYLMQHPEGAEGRRR